MKKVIVVTGAGSMGLAIAKRIGPNYKWLLADAAREPLADAARELTAAGYDVTTAAVNVASRESVEILARGAADSGGIQAIVHTASLAPGGATPEQILRVNLIGSTRIVEVFERYLSAGAIGIMVAEMAGPIDIDKAVETLLATLNADEITALIGRLNLQDASAAYNFAKRGTLAQVQAAADRWNKQGARIASISPGIIPPPMDPRQQGAHPTRRPRTPQKSEQRSTSEDIASLVDFLISQPASFITGTDVQIDGGVAVYTKLVSRF